MPPRVQTGERTQRRERVVMLMPTPTLTLMEPQAARMAAIRKTLERTVMPAPVWTAK